MERRQKDKKTRNNDDYYRLEKSCTTLFFSVMQWKEERKNEPEVKL